jgi:hypothetical protein
MDTYMSEKNYSQQPKQKQSKAKESAPELPQTGLLITRLLIASRKMWLDSVLRSSNVKFSASVKTEPNAPTGKPIISLSVEY